MVFGVRNIYLYNNPVMLWKSVGINALASGIFWNHLQCLTEVSETHLLGK